MKEILAKITDARTELVLKNPFYGEILFKMRFGIGPCETACTDGVRILFGEKFARRLNIEEVKFVMQHEVLHCVLQHLTRSKDYNREIYNVAADIVINSTLLKEMGQMEFTVDEEVPMHTVSDGREGYLFTTEEVYKMLLAEYGGEKNDTNRTTLDDHTIWGNVPVSMRQFIEDEWELAVNEVVEKLGDGYNIPAIAREFIHEVEYQSRIDWKNVLREFVRPSNTNYGYSFSPPDKRFTEYDFVLPAFRKCRGRKVDNIWFFIDASGSISTEIFSMIFNEIKACIDQYEGFRGKVSFFDTSVREEYEFEKVEDLAQVKPSGGGDTSFHCIFERLKETMMDKPPAAVVILTDGYGWFPQESEIGIESEKVLWMIVNDKVEVPWGKVVYVKE